MKKKNSYDTSATNWARIDALREEELDLADAPEVTPEMFAKGVVRVGLKPLPKKSQLTLRIDSDVLRWFKQGGRGYQTRINALLRAYMEAQQSENRKIPLRSNRAR